MLTLKFNDLFINHKPTTIARKINQYVSIMSNVNPLNSAFQSNFSAFYGLNLSYWAKNKVFFFGKFNTHLLAVKNGGIIMYSDILNDFLPRKEKSFSSKILHTIYPDRPIVDKKVLKKLLGDYDFNNKYNTFALSALRKSGKEIIVGKNNAIPDLIPFYDALIKYYIDIKKCPVTNKYLVDFDNWCKTQKIKNLSLISDTKKIDFWMWLA